jgi:hypothetical protein
MVSYQVEDYTGKRFYRNHIDMKSDPHYNYPAGKLDRSLDRNPGFGYNQPAGEPGPKCWAG